MSGFTRCYIVLVLFLGETLTKSSDDWILNIAQGPIRGHKDPAGGLYAFYNLPYATAPTGTNKFKKPLAPPTWTETFDAVDRGILCPQPYPLPNMQEDCLVANVFVPDTDVTDLSVLVYFHGGAFQYGFGNSIKLNSLVRTNRLIVVTFNYRLGAHGFLCLGTEDVPGNAGLKDQVALLRWVNNNIAKFGGSPDDVTLLGCSAGSGSIDILTLSRITSGLFKRAAIESGVAVGAIGVQMDPIANAKSYARQLHFENVHDLDALERFYKTTSFEELYSQSSAIVDNENGMILFAPCVERDVGEERVLEEAPLDIIKQGNYNDIPLLYGFANMEGLVRLEFFEPWKDRMNEKFEDFLPGELHFDDEEDKKKVADSVKAFYFGDNPISEATILAYIDYFTDTLFAYTILKALSHRILSRKDDIYLYEYSFVGENSPTIPHTEERGSNHCDQTRADVDEDESAISEDYKKMKAIMREYWLNFIWTGAPWVEGSLLPSWPPANETRAPYMSLGQAIQIKDTMLLEKRAVFWDSIYEQYYKDPVPPNSAVSLMLSNGFVLFTILVFPNSFQNLVL